MSLLDKGRQTIEAFPPVEVLDEYGNTVERPGNENIDLPITYRANVQPMTADLDMSQGISLITTYRVILRDFPHGASTLVRWQETIWQIQAEPQKQNGSPRTRHITFYMQARVPIHGKTNA